MNNDYNEQLMQDLQTVIKDAETLLRHAGPNASEDFKSARARFETTIKNAKDEIIRLENLVIDKTKETVRATDDYVKENPWQAVGLGAALGVIIGFLISRK